MADRLGRVDELLLVASDVQVPKCEAEEEALAELWTTTTTKQVGCLGGAQQSVGLVDTPWGG